MARASWPAREAHGRVLVRPVSPRHLAPGAAPTDERQKLLSLRSRALGWNLATVAAFIGLSVAVAVKATWWWPFLVILAVAGFGYLLGLSNYGVAEEIPADDANDGHPARSPVSS
jgi:hypothetical protein